MGNFITELKKIVTEIKVNIFNLLRWCVLATVVGLFVGGISVVFSALDIRANILLKTYPGILYGLPFAGLIIVYLYRFAGVYKSKGTNLVISTIQARAELPVVMAPLIFISTLITHVFGGSVGREGAALQLGSAAAAGINKIKWLKLSEEEKRMIIMCGMSAAFSAIFGTPIAAVFFPMEVASVGIIQYSAMFPCFVSSVTASWLAHLYGLHKEYLGSVADVGLDIDIIGKVALLAIFCGLISIIFCLMLKGAGTLFLQLHKSRYVQIFIGGIIFIVINMLLGTKDFLGAGMPVIERAVEGKVVWYAFFMKMLLTALCIGSGFKGGEVLPSLFIGATFGNLFAHIFGLPTSLAVACGMAGLFVGVTNCPIASLLIISELFGFKEGNIYFLLAITISYIMSGYFGLYSEQNIIYSKFRTKYINRKAGAYEEELEKGQGRN